MRIVNAARGGLVDEAALHTALVEGRVAGAGLDVFATEPCTDSPLFALDIVVATPHLGASTVEAQDKAGIAVARSVKLALEGQFVPDAVNVQAGGLVAEEIRPALPLTEKLGRVFTALAGGVATTVTVEVAGEIAAYDSSVLQLSALKGVFADVVEETVTFVNAPALAKERGVEIDLVTTPEAGDYRNTITVRGAPGDRRARLGDRHPLGHQAGREDRRRRRLRRRHPGRRPPRLLPLPRPSGHRRRDRRDARRRRINIAGAQVSRTSQGGDAFMALTVDSAIPADVLAEITEVIGAHTGRVVSLTDV